MDGGIDGLTVEKWINGRIDGCINLSTVFRQNLTVAHFFNVFQRNGYLGTSVSRKGNFSTVH